MKIAILYSGSLRNLSQSIKQNVDYFSEISKDIDLYFSVWDHIGYVDHLNAPDYIPGNRNLSSNTVITEELISYMIPVVSSADVKIKKIKIEKYDPINYKFNLINGVSDNLHAQYYKIWDAFCLLDDSQNYDFIVRLRCDLLLNNKINKSDIANLIEKNKIIFNNKIWYNYPKETHIRSINEMIWISNKDLMKRACNIYNNSDKINEIIVRNNQKDANYGENICYMNLEVENLLDNVYLFDFDYRVLR